MRLAGVGAGSHTRQPQLLHQALHPLAIDCIATATQIFRHTPRAIKWMPSVLFIEFVQQHALKLIYFFLWTLFLGIHNRARHCKKFALRGYGEYFIWLYIVDPEIRTIV